MKWCVVAAGVVLLSGCASTFKAGVGVGVGWVVAELLVTQAMEANERASRASIDAQVVECARIRSASWREGSSTPAQNAKIDLAYATCVQRVKA